MAQTISRTVGISTNFAYLNRETFAEYSEVGIGAFELSVSTEQYPLVDIVQVAKDAAAEGILTWSFHLPFYPFETLNIASFDEAVRLDSVRVQSEWMKKAAASGFRHAVIHASGEPIAENDRPRAMEQAQKSLVTLAAAAKEAGILLAVEDLPRTCLGNCSADILALVGVDDTLRVCFDTNHLLFEDSGDFLDKVKDRLVTLHVSDYDFVNERHWLPGEGKIDWVRMMDKLDAIGYRGVFMYELGRNSTKTILRETPLVPADYRRNAEELHQRKPLTKHGTVPENIGFWN